MWSRTTGPAALVALAMGAILTTASLPGGHRAQQAAPTPMQLFAKMLPVIRHDRCINCHGDVDPLTGKDHEGGDVQPGSCNQAQCHTRLKGWGLPRTSHFFTGKSDRELCGQFSDFAVKTGRKLFLTEHLKNDDLIQAAWVGDAGGANKDADLSHPSASQDEFIKLADDWFTQGHAACDAEGTISLTETVHSVDSSSPAPSMVSKVRQDGTRTVEITFANARYSAKITVNGTIWEDHVQHLANAKGPCDVTMSQVSTYTGSTSGPAKVTAKDTVFFVDTDPSQGQTDYRIDVTLPAEHTVRTRKVEIIDGCGMGATPATPGETKNLDWPEYSFTLEGHLDDVKLMNLVGSCDREIKSSQVYHTFAPGDMECNRFKNMGNGEQPWLMKQMWMDKFDGSEIPVRIVSYWNVRFRK